jgi:hypothetical protein
MDNKVADMALLPQDYPWYSFLLESRVDPRAIVRLEGLGNLKKIHLIWIRSRDFSACNMVH